MSDPRLCGVWKLVDVTSSPLSGRVSQNETLHIADHRYAYQTHAGEMQRYRYRADPQQAPAHFDLGTSLGIYKIENGTLFLCRAGPGKLRPAAFEENPVAVYTFAGPGPDNIADLYKKERRRQIEHFSRLYRDG